MTLQVNLLLQNETATDTKSVERILYIDLHGENLVKIDVFAPRALPIWQSSTELELALTRGDLRILEKDPLLRLVEAEPALPDLYRRRRDEAWNVIKDLVTDEHGQTRVAIFLRQERGALIAACLQSKAVTRQTIYTYLRKYWQAGQTKNALLPAYEHCGGRGQERVAGVQKLGRPNALAHATGQTHGTVVDTEMKKKFQRGVKQFYENPQRMPLTKTFQRTLETYFNRGYELQDGVLVPILPPAEELPTFRQFQYWYAKRGCPDLAQTEKSRFTERRFNLSYRPILGDSTQMAFGPGSIFQIDATIADIYLVSTLDPSRIIGRPVLYTIVDVFSRMVAGFSVSLEGPSWLGAMLALENATTDKVAFCAEYGIVIASQDWPVQHLPKEILADRGEMEGYNADQVVNGLGVSISNTAPYRAEWKAIVERSFRLANDQVIHWIPGAVHLPRERGNHDYRLDACLTLYQFRSLMIRQFLFHNRFHELKEYRRDEAMLSDHVEPYPLDLWNWGLHNRVGQLRQMDADLIRLNLLPEAEAAVTERGIIFRQRQYDCQKAHDEQWYVRARAVGRWKIKVAYDPRRLDILYLRLEHGQQLEPCFLHANDKALKSCDWSEILDLDELERQKEPARRTRQQQAEAALDAYVADIVEPAQKSALAERKGQSKREILKDIRENRTQEREQERQTGAWELASPPSKNMKLNEPEKEPEYIPAPRKIAWLRELDEEILKHE